MYLALGQLKVFGGLVYLIAGAASSPTPCGKVGSNTRASFRPLQLFLGDRQVASRCVFLLDGFGNVKLVGRKRTPCQNHKCRFRGRARQAIAWPDP